VRERAGGVMSWKNGTGRYFRLTGTLVDLAEAWLAQANRRREELRAFLSRFGTKAHWGTDTTVMGVALQGDPGAVPVGWRRHRDERNVIVPDKRTKAGKEIARRLARLSTPRAADLWTTVGASDDLAAGNDGRMYYVKCEAVKFDSGWVIEVPKKQKLKHPELVEIPRHEFVRLVDEHNAKRKTQAEVA